MTCRVEFQGSCHPPGKEDDYDGTFLTQSQMHEKLENLPGTPVLYEHDGKSRVGELTGGYVDEGGRLAVEGYIDRSTWQGVKTVHELRDGKLKGLSLGMEHLIDVNPNSMKIVDKKINEVSVTQNPDLPETFIKSVQPDSEHWTLAKNVLRGNWANDKLKRDLYKTKGDVLELLGDIQKNMASEEKQQQQQQQQQDRPGDTSGETVLSSDSEVQILKDKLRTLQDNNDKLQGQQNQYSEIFEEFSKDPTKVQNMLVAHKQKISALQKDIVDDKKLLEDFVTQNFIKAGEKAAPAALMKAIQQGEKNPESFEPLYKLITVAHQNNQASQKEAERRYQTLREQLEEERARTTKMEDQFEREKKANAYRNQIGSGTPTPTPSSNRDDDARPKKRTKSEMDGSQSEISTSKFDDRWRQLKPTSFGEGVKHLRHPNYNPRGIQGNEDPVISTFCDEIFGGGSPFIKEGIPSDFSDRKFGQPANLDPNMNMQIHEVKAPSNQY